MSINAGCVEHIVGTQGSRPIMRIYEFPSCLLSEHLDILHTFKHDLYYDIYKISMILKHWYLFNIDLSEGHFVQLFQILSKTISIDTVNLKLDFYIQNEAEYVIKQFQQYK